jgi:hypothetical protein
MGGRPSPDTFGMVFHVAAPVQDSVGVIKPSSLHYVATTRGSYIPDIDPKEHTLMIHGLVDRPLTFTMEDLKRLPSVTRLHFIECAGNRHNGRQKTVQESHGMTSCAEWTGVLLSTLLKECGEKAAFAALRRLIRSLIRPTDNVVQIRRLLLYPANFAIFLAQASETASESCSHPFRLAVQKSDLASTLQHDFPFCSAQSCKESCKVLRPEAPTDMTCRRRKTPSEV